MSTESRQVMVLISVYITLYAVVYILENLIAYFHQKSLHNIIYIINYTSNWQKHHDELEPEIGPKPMIGHDD